MSAKLPRFRRHLVVAVLAGAQAWASLAAASGAFVAPRDAPIRQVGEQVLLVDNADGTTTAVIQTEYQGAAPEFAWLLPVAGVPVAVTATDSVPFDRLARVTAPRFPMEIRGADSCKSTAGITVIDPETGLVPRPVHQGDDEVVVSVAGSGSVDDFEWTVISVASSTEDRTGAAIEWLVAAGFEVPEQAAPLLEPYLANGMQLLALRPQKRAASGAIRPLQVTYPGPPTLPIRLTALSGSEAMGILVYVLGPARAVPLNYPSLELNLAKLDWFEPALGYRDLVTAAVREAGGRGFVTELAQPTRELRGVGLDGESGVDDLQSLFDAGAWLTRLYMTVSPADMTLDPLFGFNPRLPAVSNVQTARLRVECGQERYYYFEAPTRIELPEGGVLRSVGGRWPAEASALPANAVIRQHGTTGPGSVLQDNTAEIDPVLEYPDGGSCAIARAPRDGLPLGFLTLALGALAAWARRARSARVPGTLRSPGAQAAPTWGPPSR